MKKKTIEKRIVESIILKNERALTELLLLDSSNIDPNSFSIIGLEDLQNGMVNISNNYKVLKSQITLEAKNASNFFNYVEDAFLKDRVTLSNQQMITINSSTISDIDFNAGDLHNGCSTSIITIDSDNQLVFKPTDGKVTNAFNKLLDWVNIFYDLGNYKFKVLNRGNYHWLEFVKQKPITSEEKLNEYYKRAGYMTCITYVLNSLDYHFENVICNGDLPLLVDHETIIQSQSSLKIQSLFRKLDDESLGDTVMDSKLLPNTLCKVNKGLAVGICGFGWPKNQNVMSIKTEGINRFSNNWKMVSKFVKHDLFKNNIPEYNGRRVYLTEYLVDFINGFESCYNLFFSQRDFLLNSEDSPIRLFDDCKIRYIWRPTNVYDKILDKINIPQNLLNFENYEQKIYDYLCVAFKNVPKDSDLMYILRHEVAQMLRGDIPFFEVNSSSRDLETEFGLVKDFFEYGAVENIQRKLVKLSFEDLENQKSLIRKSLLS